MAYPVTTIDGERTATLSLTRVGVVGVGDTFMRIPIPVWARDGTPWELYDLEAFAEVAGTGSSTNIMLNNGANDMLEVASPMRLAADGYNSKDAANQPVIDTNYDSLSGIQFVDVDIDQAGSGSEAENLTVMLHIRPA